ncbi:hypothetical protein [Bifidobacterium subtile]|jgi:hypothetical protein|uniref:hypothetical protein n=1 Tax=Bifidobacterium subtile TaxID=77635 RepID=UPI002F35E8EA
MSEQTLPIKVPEPRRDTEMVAVTPDVPETEVVPDAVKQAEASKRAAKERLGAVRGRGVEWVRASDLITRGSSVAAGAGIRFNKAAAIQTRRGVATVGRAISKRARQLPPPWAFGRRNAPANGPVRPAVGMRG